MPYVVEWTTVEAPWDGTILADLSDAGGSRSRMNPRIFPSRRDARDAANDEEQEGGSSLIARARKLPPRPKFKILYAGTQGIFLQVVQWRRRI